MKDFEEERLRNEYTPKAPTNVEKALKIEQKMKLPATIFTYIYGVMGSLIFGLGLCLAMRVFGDVLPLLVLGIIIGVIGIVMISSNYPIYKAILKKRKEQYGSAILVALNQKEN